MPSNSFEAESPRVLNCRTTKQLLEIGVVFLFSQKHVFISFRYTIVAKQQETRFHIVKKQCFCHNNLRQRPRG